MAKQHGLTLIEMLIAISILSGIIMLAGTGYSQYVTDFNKRDQRFYADLSAFQLRSAWQDQLGAAFHYLYQAGTDNYVPLFVGEKNGVLWASTRSIYKGDQPVFAWIGLQNKKLVYCEQLINDITALDTKVLQAQLCSKNKIELEHVEELSLRYYSWPGLYDRFEVVSDNLAIPADKAPRWFESVNAKDTKILPQWVVLKLKNGEDSTEIWVWLENLDLQRFLYFSGSTNA
ncbi:type II secretion system protein [Rheinheimera baltica]|uniref:Type II secretion system protein n=1 Tax=Rheinheimera baltica TaxID=67576 RepID=A0ABT9HUX9_9GAMM|nr:type II secretion system protein [Rheinheimera baltica]MDP5134930.1 type II secretion system protein [Rheinheimera baltica]MDP5149819.1 type II secretion system protein [Rheinheimera baltica]